MEDKLVLTIEKWIEMRKSTKDDLSIPIWFEVTGNSMMPFIRAYKDKVMITAIDPQKLKVGDIVLFPAKRKGGDYCLHRLFKIDGEMVQTFGDGCKRPDAFIPRSCVLGKAVLIRRGKHIIECDSPKWVRRFKLWNCFWKIRPVMLLPFRVVNKFTGFIRKISGEGREGL